MNEDQGSEVERVLLYIGDARKRAQRAAEQVTRDGADPHVVKALQDAAANLQKLHRSLSQATYYAIPDETIKLAV